MLPRSYSQISPIVCIEHFIKANHPQCSHHLFSDYASIGQAKCISECYTN